MLPFAKVTHTSPGKCGAFGHLTRYFSFNSFMCYQDKMTKCFVEILEGGGSMSTGTQEALQNINVNFHLI